MKKDFPILEETHTEDETDLSLKYAHLIATKLLGWKLLNYETNKLSPKDWLNKSPKLQASTDDGWTWQGREESKEAHDFDPYFNIEDAFEVIEVLNPKVFVSKKGPKGWHVEIDGKKSTHLYQSKAITLLLLKLIK